MANAYSVEDVLDFLAHASDRGLMPAATATALGVAVRNVLGVLGEQERADLAPLDLDQVIKRFNNKRAKDFSPSSLKEYGRRVHRAVDLFQQWRAAPADFSIKTRATSAGKKKQRDNGGGAEPVETGEPVAGEPVPPSSNAGYTSSIPIRTDWVVTLVNVPPDLTPAEADRLAKFIKLLTVE